MVTRFLWGIIKTHFVHPNDLSDILFCWFNENVRYFICINENILVYMLKKIYLIQVLREQFDMISWHLTTPLCDFQIDCTYVELSVCGSCQCIGHHLVAGLTNDISSLKLRLNRFDGNSIRLQSDYRYLSWAENSAEQAVRLQIKIENPFQCTRVLPTVI